MPADARLRRRAASRSAAWSAGRRPGPARPDHRLGRTSRSAPRSATSWASTCRSRCGNVRRRGRARRARPGRRGRLRQRHLPVRRRRRRRRHHRRRAAGSPGTAGTAARSATWWWSATARPASAAPGAAGRPRSASTRLLRAAGRSDARGREALLAVFDAADRGDARAQTAVRQVGDWLGFGVANLVNIFNPEMVIFGGTLRDVYLAAAAQVRSRLNRNGAAAPAGSTSGCAPRSSATTRP